MRAKLSVAMVLFLPLFTAQASDGPCDKMLSEPEYFAERRLEAVSDGALKFTDKSAAFLVDQREKLRQTMMALRSRFFEVDHATRRLLLAEMLQTHVVMDGGPGSAKSALARLQLGRRKAMPDGSSTVSLFSIQMNQLIGDAAIRGFLDTMKLKDRDVTVDQVTNTGTIVHFSNALVDELDKMNPLAAAAFLDIMNEKIAQYGPITIKVRTKTIVATSNMTIYEFIQAFKDQGMESTAHAFIDRIPFKVYLHNYLTNPELRRLHRERADGRRSKRALDFLVDPESAHRQEMQEVIQVVSDLPSVDMVWLGALAESAGKVTKNANKVLDEVSDQVRSGFYGLRRKSEQDALEDPSKPIYYPPTIFSTRNAELERSTIKASVFLDLLLLPEEKLPSEDLRRLIEGGIPIDRFSVWRLQDLILTAAAGDPAFVTGTGENNRPTYDLQYGPELQILASNSLGTRETVRLQYIAEERRVFGAALKGILEEGQDKLIEVSDALAKLEKLLGPQPKTTVSGIEEYLQLIGK